MQLLNEQVNSLDQINLDLSAWDDTYDFVDSKSQEYIDSNLGIETFENFESSFFYVFDQNKNVIWGDVFFEHEDDDMLEGVPLSTEDLLPFLNPYLHNIEAQIHDVTYSEKGMFLYHDMPVLFSIQPILKSDYSGPKVGYLAQGQFLDQRFIKKLKENIKLDFTIEHINPRSTMLASQYSVVHETEKELTMSADYQSNGKPIIRVNLRLNRDISQQGANSIQFGLLSLLLISVVSIGLIWFVIKILILKPLTTLKLQMTDIARSKDYSQRAIISAQNEMRDLSNTFNDMLTIIEISTSELETTNSLLRQDHLALYQAESKLRQANLELEKLSLTDTLTGVANRLAFEQKLQLDWLALRRSQSSLTIFMIDIDHFKNFNDFYGHQQGDKCIQQVASILSDNLKRPADLVARYGGEEFIVILPDTEPSAALHLAHQIQASFADANIEHINSQVASHVTVSIGIASFVPVNDLSWDSLIDAADKALYRAKQKGRNRVETYTVEC